MQDYGWKPDLPDFRDFATTNPLVREAFRALEPPDPSPLPSVDLEEYVPPIRAKESLVSSSVSTCVALLEYFQRRVHGDMQENSSLFVQKTASRLSNTSDCCVDLRTTLKALVRYGLPPEHIYPTTSDNVGIEPLPYAFGFTDRYSSVRYMRLSRPDKHGNQILQALRSTLAAGFPVVFGFPVPNSFTDDMDIPFRPTFDKVLSGAAVVAVGYDDRHRRGTVGAIRIRGCWGPNWGDEGFGWLPYEYVQQNLVTDLWSVYSDEFLASGEFHDPVPTNSPPDQSVTVQDRTTES